MEQILQINDVVNSFIWGPVTLIALIGLGLFLSIRNGFFQFTQVKKPCIIPSDRWEKVPAIRTVFLRCRLFWELSAFPSVPATSPALRPHWSPAAPARSSGCGSLPWLACSPNMPRLCSRFTIARRMKTAGITEVRCTTSKRAFTASLWQFSLRCSDASPASASGI